ncbi:MAG: hypothetical protein JWQ33_3093 [Ramlibacter sp.]|nr:hypothetical protein [Ramlibacter sp.]
MKNLCIAAMLALACGAGIAKIPAPVLDDAAKAKAAEAAARTAWQAKVDAFQLCRVQDRVAAFYRKSAGAAAAASAARPASGPAAAGAPAAGMVAANPAVAGGTAAAPAGSPTPTPCADPGAFAYNAPSETPLETSGAHSPAGNAVSPPSVRANSAEMAPAKK